MCEKNGTICENNEMCGGSDTLYTAHYNSPIGDLLLAARDPYALGGLWIEGQKYFPKLTGEKPVGLEELPVFLQTGQWLDRYFAGERPGVSELQLAPSGSEFAKSVWNIMKEIPYGGTTTYGKIAEQIARERGVARMSAQAVGGAVGHNPILIIFPCHRVVGSNGSLTGYAGGMDRKVKLLEHEGVDMSRFFIPRGLSRMGEV